MRTLVAVLSVLVVALAGCSADEKAKEAPTGLEAVKIADGGAQTDTVAIATQFPALGTPIDALWYTGTLGTTTSGRTAAPGPSVYWTDAVVTVTPETMAALNTNTYASDRVPGVYSELTPSVPTTPGYSSAQLDESFSTSAANGLSSQVWLYPELNLVVIVSTDG